MRSHQSPWPRRLVIPGAAVIALASLVTAGLASAPSRSATAARTSSLDGPSRIELVSVLGRVGLTPERLAAAGVSANQTGALVATVRTGLSAAMPMLRTAETTQTSAGTTADQLRRKIQSGRATPEDMTAFEAARTQHHAAAAQVRQVLDGTLQALVESLTPAQRATLAVMRANVSREVPTQYLAANRSEAEWTILRDTLASESIAQRSGQTPDPEAHQIVLTANANPAVAAATASLSANLEAVTAAWNQAVGP